MAKRPRRATTTHQADSTQTQPPTKPKQGQAAKPLVPDSTTGKSVVATPKSASANSRQAMPRVTSEHASVATPDSTGPINTEAATPGSTGANNSATTPNSTGANISATASDSTAVQKRTGANSDIPPGHLNPVVATQRVDADKENSRLQAMSEKRRAVAKHMLDKSDLSQFMKPLKKNQDSDDDEPMDLPQVEPLNLVVRDNNENSDGNDSQDTEEKVIGTVTLSSAEEEDPIYTDQLDQFSTKKITGSIKRLRRKMDLASERFLRAYNECERIRTEYTEMATQHERLAFNLHVRRALNVKRHVQRPFTLTETNLLEGKKLRSGTIIKDEKVNVNTLDDEAFEFISKDMLKTFK